MLTLVLGSNGFLGQRLLKFLPNSIGSNTRLENIKEELENVKPTHVVSAAGISGKPTVMWCEYNKDETTFVNLTQQLYLIDVCKKLNIHLTILGSGQVYDGDKYFTEDDEPNYYTLFYSRIRIFLENVIRSVYMDDVLYLRILYPVSLDGHEKCFLEKMKKRKNNVHNTRVSLTVIPHLFPKIQTLIEKRVTGIMNFTNDGCIYLKNFLDIFNEKCVVSHESSDRGECKLDVSRLKNYIEVGNVIEILKNNGTT